MSRRRRGGQPSRRGELRLQHKEQQVFELLHSKALIAPALRACQFRCELDREGSEPTEVTVDAAGHLLLVLRDEGTAEEAAWLVAHALLHLCFEHFQERPDPLKWHIACDVVVARFLQQMVDWPRAYGRGEDLSRLPAGEAALYEELVLRGVPEGLPAGGFGRGEALLPDREPYPIWVNGAWMLPDWPALLAEGVRDAVTEAVEYAAGRTPAPGSEQRRRTAAREALDWFISSYPLLGALAAGFELVEDAGVCAREGITIAAICPDAQELFVNPGYRLTPEETRFVVAHELLHVGLCHVERRRGREPFLWNVACDYVINDWLIEMDLGDLPAGVLHDPELRGLSTERVYDRLAGDLRRQRRLSTLRGRGLPDILERHTPEWWRTPAGCDLDRYFRRCLAQGLRYHSDQGRGLLPAGLVEAIRALEQPPIPWDVELAQWFERHFPAVDRQRTFARPSRRQAATPDIPRPRYVAPDDRPAATFGVVLDTSGSMSRALVGKALGAIAGYAIAHEVPAVRVVFCDAAPYDEGYCPPEALLGRVRVRGRGGTVLQPAIDLLERADDFPETGPILILTDALCDRLRIRREHAFLLPEGARLPFEPRGEVFRVT